MAAPSSNAIRVRLYFDYPPPAVSECRMCWVLVDLNKCRVVGDLESIIRDRFDFGRKSILNLYVEDCYLPHTESIFVVRDNDSIRVKVDSVIHVNGCSSQPETSRKKKRQRQSGEDEQPAENGLSLERKKKRKKEKCDEKQNEQAFCDKIVTDAQRKLTKKKKKKKQKDLQENCSTATPTTSSTKKNVTPVGQAAKSTRRPPDPKPADQLTAKQVNDKTKAQEVSSASSDSSSENDEAPKKTPAKPGPKMPPSFPAPSSVLPKLSAPKLQPAQSSSSDTDSSSDEAPVMACLKSQLKNTSSPKPNTPTAPKAGSDSKNTPSALQPTNCAQNKASGSVAGHPENSSDSDCSSEEEIRLVIKKPLQGQGLGMRVAPARDTPPSEPSGRGRGCGNAKGVGGGGGGGRGDGKEGRGARGRGARGRGAEFCYNYDSGHQRKQISYHSDSSTNTSVVLQAEVAQKRDYSSLPLLAAPPPVGQKIAFKLLELTENYSPEVSEYKEGKIVSFDPATQQIELQLLNVSHAPVEPGKFDLVYEDPDGSERVEYAVSRGSSVAERWDSLLEPRLII